ncbi:hypothetical protein BRY73_17445 [Ochrobactrum sp. P6BS-III]|nr:hypothetical protein [Ochrobactrum sp. P6BSIII]OOL15755.1 hypothetical protein BRY73_17445 [Ochrobactrum sp. P6BS-III]
MLFTSASHEAAPITLPFIDINKHLVFFGVVSIIIRAGVWVMNFSHLVYACPYCRIERTAIRLLSIMILLRPHINVFIA